jgi:hypothetical protein
MGGSSWRSEGRAHSSHRIIVKRFQEPFCDNSLLGWRRLTLLRTCQKFGTRLWYVGESHLGGDGVQALRFLLALTLLIVGVSQAPAYVVWIDHFENPLPPGTEQFWLPAWGTWTSMGISYYRGTTTSFQGEGYVCGTACLTQSGASEYSFFGSFLLPSATGALAASFISGLDIADSNGYVGVADFLDQAVILADTQADPSQPYVGSVPFGLQQGVWYQFRQEADLSESPPWVRLKVWESTQPEPVYWTVEGTGTAAHPGQHVLLAGADTLSTGQVRFDDVGVESQIAPRRVTDLSAAVAGADVQLSWTVPPTSDATSLYQGTIGYFEPSPGTEVSGIMGGTYTASGATGDPATNHFYLVRCVNESGEGPPSNRVGEFDFALETP